MIGARRIFVMKGGAQYLGELARFQMFFARAELRWTMHIAPVATVQEVPVYPAYPFWPDLC